MTPPRLAYQPALDGIRAIAILLVLGLHGRVLPSGFIGVDLFFVLSGFLITALLLREWEQTRAISLLHFYGRRARRLLPALGVLIIGVGIIYVALPHVDRGLGYWTSVAAVAGYAANWVEAFEARNHPSPLGLFGHTWSLGIEEQFYIVWPLVLVLLLRWHARRVVVAAVLIVLAAASAVEADFVWRDYGNFAAFDRTDTHSYGLLLGCACAMLVLQPGAAAFRTLLRRPEAGAIATGALGLAVVALRADATPAFFVAWPLVSLAAAVLVGHVVLLRTGLLARLLSFRPLVWVGIRSYGIYLYHFPIFFVVAPATLGLSKYSLLAITAPLCVVAAALSYRIVERPFLLRFQYPRIAEASTQAESRITVGAFASPTRPGT